MLAASVKTGRLPTESPSGPSVKLPKRAPAKTEKVIVEVCVSVSCQSCRSTTVKKERSKISMESAAKHKPAAHRMRRCQTPQVDCSLSQLQTLNDGTIKQRDEEE